jgi:enoyl-CoA hydratase
MMSRLVMARPSGKRRIVCATRDDVKQRDGQRNQAIAGVGDPKTRRGSPKPAFEEPVLLARRVDELLVRRLTGRRVLRDGAVMIDPVPEYLHLARGDGFAVVTLDRGAKRNALSFGMRRGLAALLTALAADDAIACGVLTGAAPDFCAGMDVTRFGGDEANRREIVDSTTVLFDVLGAFPKPLVAAVEGRALGGGLALLLACDIRIAGRGAVFGMPEVKFGAAGGFAALRAAVGDGPARELALTARSFGAGEAYRLGMLAELVDDGGALARAEAVAAELTALPRRGLLLQTDIIRHTAGRPLAEGLAYEQDVFRRALLRPDPNRRR